MRYSPPLHLTGGRYIRMQGESRARVDSWLTKYKLLENYTDINSIEIVGSHSIRLVLFTNSEVVRLSVPSPLSLSEWIEAIDQADAELN